MARGGYLTTFPYGVAVAREALTLKVLVQLRTGGASGGGRMSLIP